MKKIILTFGLMSVMYAGVFPVQAWNSNGVPVWFSKSDTAPIVDIALVFNAGAVQEHNELGVAALTNSAIFSGCGHKSDAEVSRQFELYGAEYNASSGYDSANISIRAINKDAYLLPVVDLLATCIARPKFEPAALLRHKQQNALEYLSMQKKALHLAISDYKSQVYNGHRYGTNYLGNDKSMLKIKRSSVIKFHKHFYSKSNMHLIIVGNLSEGKARAIANKITQKIKNVGKAKQVKKPVVKKANNKNIYLANQAQTTTVLGFNGINLNSKDLIDFELGNFVVGGGGLSSKLMLALRENYGYVYSVSIYPMARVGAGELYLLFKSRPEVALKAKDLALKTLNSYVSTGLNEQELMRAKKHFLQKLFRNRATNAGVLEELSKLAVTQRPVSDYNDLEKRVKLATVESVNAAFKQVFHNQKPTVITVAK